MKELFRNEIVRKAFLSDILGIPEEEIRTARLLNPFLRKRYKKQKLGILDILLELNDDTRINIEIQLKASSSWDRRQIFYLSKLFTSDLKVGENYSRLKRCIGISILDFNLTDRPEYHSIYFLQDEKGNRFSDVFEIHTIELKKKLMGNEAADDWIRLFNAESEEDLEMIKTEEEKDKIIAMLIADMQEDGKSREQVQAKLQQRFALTEQEAEEYLGHFWK